MAIDCKPLPQTSKVILIPFDPDSEEHAKRLHDQRIACGWNSHRIEDFRDLQREGKKAIHWITLSPSLPNYETLIKQHLSRYPGEIKPITDTATHLLQKPRLIPASNNTFTPIGHISLDSWHTDPTLANPALGVYAITLFYISNALQSTGLGGKTMTVAEKMAVEVLNAKALALSTPCRESHFDDRKWEAYGKERPAVCTQDWYARKGYQVYKYEDDYVQETDQYGKVWHIRFVFMRKCLSSS